MEMNQDSKIIFNRISSDPTKEKFLKNFFFVGSDEVLLKIILESLIHINALNRMEINLLS